MRLLVNSAGKVVGQFLGLPRRLETLSRYSCASWLLNWSAAGLGSLLSSTIGSYSSYEASSSLSRSRQPSRMSAGVNRWGIPSMIYSERSAEVFSFIQL